jgi:hypothetical protein
LGVLSGSVALWLRSTRTFQPAGACPANGTAKASRTVTIPTNLSDPRNPRFELVDPRNPRIGLLRQLNFL